MRVRVRAYVFAHVPSSSTVTRYALQADPSLLVALQLYKPESEGFAWVNTMISVEAITYTPSSVLSAVILQWTAPYMQPVLNNSYLNVHSSSFTPHISWCESAFYVAV